MFCLKDDIAYASVTFGSDSLTADTIRFVPTDEVVDLAKGPPSYFLIFFLVMYFHSYNSSGLSQIHEKNVFACPTIFSNSLTLDKDGYTYILFHLSTFFHAILIHI